MYEGVVQLLHLWCAENAETLCWILGPKRLMRQRTEYLLHIADGAVEIEYPLALELLVLLAFLLWMISFYRYSFSHLVS